MKISNDVKILIHLALRRLIDEKSKRDNVKFTGCQLAQALGMPRSMITKLTHPEKNKRVINPRIDTLIKIVNFFKTDGFNITLEDLLGLDTKIISVKDQVLHSNTTLTLPVYSLDDSDKKIGHVDIRIANKHKNKNLIALCADRDIQPFFKAGSIFIIEPNAPLEDGILIAVKFSEYTEIKKYCINKNKIILKSLEEDGKEITLMPTSSVNIIGIIVQVNANT